MVMSLSGHSDGVECLAWSGDGALYSGSRDRTVKVWRSESGKWRDGKLANTLQGHGHRVNALALASASVGPPVRLCCVAFDEISTSAWFGCVAFDEVSMGTWLSRCAPQWRHHDESGPLGLFGANTTQAAMP